MADSRTVFPEFIAPSFYNRSQLIQHYFSKGLTGLEILHILAKEHGIHISLRHLRRLLAKEGLQRRHQSSFDSVYMAIQEELKGSGSCLGYRAMKLRLEHKYSLHVSRHTVLDILRELDPHGINSRRKHCLRRRAYFSMGPNYMIHIDGYDKLKPYGFSIHGAIDGYSRRILWLKVGRTNNDPAVVGSYFADYVKSNKGVPWIVRMDAGTENGIIANIQKSFRWHHNDTWAGHKSVIIGSSSHNQRIERWWGFLRRHTVQYWMDIFKEMEHLGVLSRDNGIKKEILRFCLMTTIQTELDTAVREWNTHRIRPSRNLHTIPGKPDSLFFMPSLHGTSDCKLPVDINELGIISQENCKPGFRHGCTDEVAQTIFFYLNERSLSPPSSRQEALELYGVIIDDQHIIESLLIR